jgi:hypothetical protein
MKFREIIFVGVDLEFQPDKEHFYNSAPREKDWARRISQPRAELMRNGFDCAYRAISKETDIKVFNASGRGRLDCIPRVDYETLFG